MDKTHNETSTTFKADAGYKKYHCGFFCTRQTSTDVIDPKQTNQKNEPQPKEFHKPKRLT